MSSQSHLQVLSDVSSPFQVKLLKTFVNSNYHLFLPSYLLLKPRLCRLSPLHFSKMALCEFTSPYSFRHLSSWFDFSWFSSWLPGSSSGPVLVDAPPSALFRPSSYTLWIVVSQTPTNSDFIWNITYSKKPALLLQAWSVPHWQFSYYPIFVLLSIYNNLN